MQHVAYGDPIAGLYGTIACLLALYNRNRRNAGAIIDLGQVECLFQLCADAIVAQSVQSAALPRQGSRHPTSAMRAVIGTATPNQWFAVAVEAAGQWNALAGVIGRSDLAMAATARLADLKAREINMEQAVRAWAASRNVSETVAALQAAGVSAGPVYAAVDLLDDSQFVQSGFWRRAERAFIGKHVVPHTPYQLDGARPPLHTTAPTLGQHNHDVLGGDLGLSPGEIDALHADGIIGTRAVAATAG
jgi:crotonobetainyl-CoA:carnitine CoA-transferase CaiB-like acyl-CoA transferase